MSEVVGEAAIGIIRATLIGDLLAALLDPPPELPLDPPLPLLPDELLHAATTTTAAAAATVARSPGLFFIVHPSIREAIEE